MEEFSKGDKVVFVAKLVPDSKEAEIYRKIAEEFRNDYTFAQVAAKSPSLEVYKKFDEGRVTYDGKFEKEAVTEFVYKESTPLVAEIGPGNYANYMKSGMPLAYFFYEDEEQKTSFTSALKDAVSPYKGQAQHRLHQCRPTLGSTLMSSTWRRSGRDLSSMTQEGPQVSLHRWCPDC